MRCKSSGRVYAYATRAGPMSLALPKSRNTRRSSASRGDPKNATSAVDAAVVVKRPRATVSSHTGGGIGVGDGDGGERFSPIGDDLDFDGNFDVDLDL